MFHSLKSNQNEVTSLGTGSTGEAKGLAFVGLFPYVFYLFLGVT